MRNEYETLRKDNQALQERFAQQRHKYKRAALILTDFLEDLLEAQPSILQGDPYLHL
jgi:hypothetical protein